MKNQFKKVLILRFGAIGDVIHSTGLFRSLKKIHPEISVHYAAFKTPSLMINNDSDIDKLWIIEEKSYKHLLTLAKELKKENFDIFINLQPSIKTAVMAKFIGAKHTLTYKKTFKLHAAENFWRTATPLFKDIILDDGLKIHLTDQERDKVSSLLPTDKTIIGFNIGTTTTRQGRKWKIEYWAKLAQMIQDKYDSEIILTGSNDDLKEVNQLLEIMPELKSFCGKLHLRETSALFERCDLVISGDTGPLHIASALNTNVIGLYGAAPISRTGPYGKKAFAIKADTACSPCNKRKCKYLKKGEKYTPCMNELKPELVFDLIEKHKLLD